MNFRELGLSEPIVRAVADEGYDTPTPIQTKSIPDIIAGRDVLGCAQTGTGKTGAFALPILHRLAEADVKANAGATSTKRHRTNAHKLPRAIILAPTRELATQIFESFKVYGRHLKLRHTAIFGGVSQHHQVRALRNGIDVLVATPGRLLDLMQQGYVDLSEIETLVLDEADRMLDMGFINDIRKVVARMPQDRQTLLFSATMPGEIRSLADSILCDPVFVKAAPVATPAESIAQTVYLVSRQNKATLLERLLRQDHVERTLIFTRTKHGADKLVRALGRAGIEAHAIHGNKSQNNRTRALQAFKSGRSPVLVATDIASRGIDVDDVTHVFNFDMPDTPETYVHRIGRTARAGASGNAVSFCDHEELGDLRAIERLIGRQLEMGDGESDLLFNLSDVQQQRTMRHAAAKSNGRPRRNQRSRSQGGAAHHAEVVTRGSRGGSRPKQGRRGQAGAARTNRKSSQRRNAAAR